MTIRNGTTGNDTLNGSLGGNVDDVLNGDLGDDLYQYTLGSGNDVINDTGGIDTVQLGDPLHLFTGWNFYRSGNDLVMDFYGQGRVTVTDQFLLGLPVVEVLGFSDGGTPYSFSNSLTGTAANDVLIGTASAETITGNGGDDLIFGHGGNDTLFGGDGDDELSGGAGNNTIDGGAGGRDAVSYDDAPAGVTVSLATAGPQATGGSGTDTLVSIENLIGSGFNDSLIGNAGNNVLDGGAGSDFLNGGVGTDTMLGGDGTDSYCVDHASDLVTESNGSLATGGNDIVYSYLSAYTLSANVERLRLMLGGASNATGNGLDNILYAGDGNNVLDGVAGTDTVSYAFSTTGVTLSLATAGAQATGGSASDTLISIENLIGSGFNDNLTGNAGDNVLDGAAGTDTVTYALAGAGVTVSLTTAGAQATGGSGSDTLISIENLTGSGFDDSLIGNAGNNVLDGGVGNDTLNGGTGADTMLGGDGSDLYTIDHVGDLVTETNAAAAGGTDTVNALVDHTLGANVENLNLIAAGAVNGTGNALDNVIYAGTGNNVIDGAAGTDTVSYAFAGAGVTLSLASAGAQATGGSGSDTLLNFENLTGSGFNDSLVGNTANNVLDGGTGSDFLNGATGADTMLGGDGTDSYAVDHAGDLVSESNSSLATGGNDIVYSYLAAYSLTANVERLRLMLAGASNGTGNALDNTLYAGDGNNVLDGAAGTDTVSYAFAGAGVTLSLATSGAQATGGSGTDTLVSIENLIGSGFNDNFTGNTANNVLDGGAGSDFLNGGVGADTMLGGDGTDSYCVDHAGDLVSESNSNLATGGNDIVYSYLSAYTLTANIERLRLMLGGASNGTGNGLDNILYAGDGNNVLDGAAGNDTVSYAFAGVGVTVSLATAGAQATGGSGTDTLISIEHLIGSSFNDSLIGNTANNVLDGGAGSDFLNGGVGADTMFGGDGTDSYCVDHAGDLVSESNSSLVTGGNDIVYSYVLAYTLTANVERLRLMLGGASNGTGNSLDNTLYAGAGDNVLDGATGTDTVSYAFASTGVTVSLASAGAQATGGSGTDTLLSIENLIGSGFNDSLIGNTGNNTLDGGIGADTMNGGLGNDTFIVDNAGDYITELAGQGIDTVMSSVTRYLGNYQENLTLTGVGTINGYGNSDNNVLTGNSAANVLSGNAGADTMSGGAGDDTYYVENVGDVVTESAASGKDTVNSSISYTLTADVEWLVLTGAAITGTGNNLNNFLVGNGGNNTLDGGAGADTMNGGLGDDTFIVDNAGDYITELAGQGIDTVMSSVTRYLGSNQENLTLTGANAINGYGFNDDNLLRGNSAANVLSGGGGADTLAGGLGNDSLSGGNGADKFQFDSAPGVGNVDTLSDFLSGTDLVQLAQANFSSLAVGAVAADAFVAGAGYSTAADADDRLIYNTNNGVLFYDADGLGGDAAVPFAVLIGHPTLLSTDFIVS
jgi:Ca2+-binding RTX toxin-like protein